LCIIIHSGDHVKIDDKDKMILRLLQDNANISLRDIEKEFAAQTGEKFSTTAIRARLKKLKDNDVIRKSITLINCHRLGYKEMVMASLRLNSSQSIEDVKQKLDNMKEIKFAYVITGDYPIFIMAKCLDHMDAISLIEDLRNLPGVEEVKTQVVLDRIKEDPTVIIPD